MPWVVRIFLQKENQLRTHNGFQCTAIVIDNFWLATTRNCCKDIRRIKILFNFDRSNDESKEEPVRPVLPDEDIDICLIQSTYDIIEDAKKLGYPVKKICLPDKAPQHGTACWITGWKSRGPDRKLQAVDINIMSAPYCRRHSSYGDDDIKDNDVCAGYPSYGNKPVQRSGLKLDSVFGGPLICLSSDAYPVLTGLASKSSLSLKEGYPGVFTNIFAQKTWIDETISKWSEWTKCSTECSQSRRRVCSKKIIEEGKGCDENGENCCEREGLDIHERTCVREFNPDPDSNLAPDQLKECWKPRTDDIDTTLKMGTLKDDGTGGIGSGL